LDQLYTRIQLRGFAAISTGIILLLLVLFFARQDQSLRYRMNGSALMHTTGGDTSPASDYSPSPLFLPLLSGKHPLISFKYASLRGSETAPTVSIPLSLSFPVNFPVTVQYSVTAGIASAEQEGSGQDYALTGTTLTFQPGSTEKTINLQIFDDIINESDEEIVISLLSAPNAVPGASQVTYTIADNDRATLVDVVAGFGAKGDGVTDDTQAIQRAIDAVYALGGGVVLFPPRVYLVTSVTLYENITYQGYGATIKRPPMQGKWTRTFNTGTNPYKNSKDSRPLIIKGLTFDGNSQAQGPYKQYELEQAHLIFLSADPTLPGRLQAVVEDCTLNNNVGDGLSVNVNVVVKMYNCTSSNVFRGGFVLTGGNSSATVTKVTTMGKIDPTGIDIEVDGKGYGGTYRVDVRLKGLRLLDGDFDIAVSDNSTVTGDDIIAEAPFYLYGLNSRLHFTNSTFKVGAADEYSNRIVLPHDISFENCTFYVTRKETGNPYSFFAVADIWWQLAQFPAQYNQTLTFTNCRFMLDDNIRESDITNIIYAHSDVQDSKNRLIIRNSCAEHGFDNTILAEDNNFSSVVDLVECKADA
jgi:hypothetical protein